MNIVFLCGSLEPGKDGVGDYTRLLASKLISYGNKVLLIALNDSFIDDKIVESQAIGEVQIDTVRLSANQNEKTRFNYIVKLLTNYQSDWVSLQFVPYSFNKKGLPFSFIKLLKRLSVSNWQIMFHEMWIDKPEKLSQRLISILQKQIIRKVILTVNPKVVHVSVLFNQKRLKEIGVSSNILELFGNILKVKQESQITDANANNANGRILYFGSAPRGNYKTLILDGIEQYCKQYSSPITIAIISGESEHKKDFISSLENVLSPYHGSIADLGFLDEDILSTVLSGCTVGIARSEPHLLGKSGSAIAMLEHGLPVWLPKWKSGQSIDFSFRTHLIFSELAPAMETIHEHYISRLPEIAKQFELDLINF